MAKQSCNASKRERPSQKQEKQTAENNVGAADSESQRPKRLKRSTEEESEKSSVLKRAKEFAAELPLRYPSFVKEMLPSHVSRGFWLGLPTAFCRNHIGASDKIIWLEDETGEKFETKYLAAKMGLSAGWRGFSIAHNLLKGDAVVFQKVDACEFKVYIVKPNGSDEVNCSHDHAAETQMVSVTTSSPISSDLSEENTEDILNYIDNYEDDPSEFLEGVRVSEIAVPFKEVTCIEKFKVIIDGLNINSEIPKPILKKYYELCRSQNSYLHQNLVERLNCKLVVGLISETVNIADAIKACKMTTAESDFLTWDKTLQASEILGMNISFLRTRLTELASLASEAQRYKDSRLEREQREAEYRAMLANYLEVKDEADREESKKLVKLDVSFKEVTKAPWRSIIV